MQAAYDDINAIRLITFHRTKIWIYKRLPRIEKQLQNATIKLLPKIQFLNLIQIRIVFDISFNANSIFDFKLFFMNNRINDLPLG